MWYFMFINDMSMIDMSRLNMSSENSQMDYCCGGQADSR